MTEEEKWQYLYELDEKLLKGGVLVSEWATFLIKDSDLAFVSGAYLASIITGLAGVETHLRSESSGSKNRFVELIDGSDINSDLKNELHVLRKYRNKWVHISAPWDDVNLLNSPEIYEQELESMAKRCVTALRRTIYTNPWI